MALKKKIINFGSILYRNLEYKYYSFIRRFIKSQGIIIIGCGRSGTTYTSKRFKSLGFNVGHERLKKHGISSWYLVSNQEKVPLGPSFKQIKKLKLPIVHQVRQPLKAVSSLQSTGRPSWEFLSKEIPIDYQKDSKILRAMKYWYYWNLMAEKKSLFTYQIEEIDINLPKLLDVGKFQRSYKTNIVSKTTNTRDHIDLTWHELKNEDIGLAQKIIELGIKYGYEIKE